MKKFLLILALLSLPVFIWFFWQYSQTPETISSTLKSFDKAGEETKKDLSRIPSLPVTEDENSFTMQDDDQTGLSITYANQTEENQLAPEKEEKDPLSLSFPKDQTKPIEIKLDKERTITIQDLKNQKGFSSKTVSNDVITDANTSNESFFQKLFKKTNQEEIQPTYLTATDQRKTLLYTFQKDHATNEKKLKSWTLYEKGNGIEEEAYRFTNAKIKINDDGDAEVFYFGDKDIQNQQAKADVEPSLLERAQRVISQDMGEDILNSNKNPDFLIPKPFFYDKNGDIHETDWKYDEETNTLSLQISTKDDLYPIALDPTLAFTAPGQSNTGWVVTGRTTSTYFSDAMVAGDFNADGKTDLAVGAASDASNGRVYIFYNDGFMPRSVNAADVMLSGSGSSDAFGYSLAAGDFNFDGRIDLAVGAYYHDFVSIFYNDGSMPTTAATADVTITGLATDHSFGFSLAAGDFNADGRTDLAVGAYTCSSSTGCAYIFYNDGSIPTSYSSADVTITGETTNNFFGASLTSGDFNADGRTDLTVGAYRYSSYTGRAYIFYNDGSIPTTAGTADVIITGEAVNDSFSASMASGDLNADGKVDLVTGTVAYPAANYTGRVYIFHNDGSIPTTGATADVIITGEGGAAPGFGNSLSVADLNADGRADLVVGAKRYSTDIGRAYIFYNDGSISTAAATADVMIKGEIASGNLGASLACGDFNFDGKMDLAIGANGYVSGTGRVYILTSENGQVNTNVNLVGETTSNYFGYAMTSGDFNADGRMDLAIGSYGYSSFDGRAYVFYNDGGIPTTAATADVIITGETGSSFGYFLSSGDFNADGEVDLAVGAYGYSTDTGRAYIFYNDGSIPTTAATADVIITGETTSNYFGISLTSGDFNADGEVDLAVSASGYSTDTGRVYIFYNDGSIPTTAATADVIITGETSGDNFGYALFAPGDFNVDGNTDLTVGGYGYSSSAGRVYIFYSGSITTENASGADILITGESSSLFGAAVISGDFNADGRADLSVGAYTYSTQTGRAYVFYNDGSIPTTAATADIIITGETTNNNFGCSLVPGDFNADGRTDFSVGADGYSSSTGRAYVFYNDGSIPTTAATADVIITGETTSNNFGYALTSGDFNFDGKIDLAVGAYGYSTNTGRVYLYETRDNFSWQLQSVPSLTGGLRTNPSFSGQEFKVTGEVGTGQFGDTLISGDFNADGKTDLAVGASAYSSSTGRIYIFYSDGHLAAAAMNADVVITGEASSSLGASLAVGDFNSDGRTDLAAGNGKVYIFYSDGSIPTTAATADVQITAEAGNNIRRMVGGDFNADGTVDLAFTGDSYSTFTGRAYIVYNDGSYPAGSASADVIITGTTTNDYFGYRLGAGDLNADSRTDLVVADFAAAGKTYIFYNDGSIPTTAGTADVTITGFGAGLHTPATGDFNADGRVDLAVGNSSGNGSVYIFYNDGSIPTTVGTADVTISGEGSSQFGSSLVSGDFNFDSRMDLAVGANNYSTSTGRAYIFYNDGSIPTTAATADVIITGEASSSSFGTSLTSGDFNADGKTNLVVGASGYDSNRGRVYMYTFNDGVMIGETTSNNFGYSLASGDFNADGKTDLAVGANTYSTSTGRAYIFYNDGSIPTTAATADVIITGEASSQFGFAMSSGDFNADGKTDLVVGAIQYSSYTGRAYLFYNDGSIPTTAATADVIITGAANDSIGGAFSPGDFNFDGKTDLAVLGAGLAKVFLFYNDGSIPTTSATADVKITGFGIPSGLASGDFNADGRVDLAIGDMWQSSGDYTGKTYLFYNDGSIPTTPGTADLTITGETTNNYFGATLVSGDFNFDGKTDLAIGAYRYGSYDGRAYIFYNDGSIPTTAATADVIISSVSGAGSYFGYAMTSGDFNADGKTDLAIGAQAYSINTGRAYIFYNDGSIPTTAASADVIMIGAGSQNFLGFSLISGDFNSDGKTDLAIGSYLFSSSTGRAYIFMTEAKVEEALPQLQSIGATEIIGNFEVR